MYVGGGITIAIVLGLILLPLAGIALWFPFSNANTEGTVNYRSTETLNFNEYWYEYENIKEGNNITYSLQSLSLSSLISFAIWDQPFEDLPPTTKNGNDTDQLVLTNDWYEYIQYYLKPGSSITYNFNASSQIDFFIASGQDLYDWNLGGSPSFFVDSPNVIQGSGVYNVLSAMDYYLVWYNDGLPTVTVNFTIDYTASNVVDLSAADFYVEGVNTVSQDTFTVPNDGNWYFFVYFDPMLSPEESITITFDVTYDTGINSADRWIEIQPILITIIVVVSSKVAPAKAAPAKAALAKATEKKTKKSTSTCIRCNSSIRSDASFCPNCGGKVEGRITGIPTIVTPAKAKSCSFCGSKLVVDDKFCKWCGTKVES